MQKTINIVYNTATTIVLTKTALEHSGLNTLLPTNTLCVFAWLALAYHIGSAENNPNLTNPAIERSATN